MELLHFYRIPGDNSHQILQKIQRLSQPNLQDFIENIIDISTEYCYNIEVKPGCVLSHSEKEKLLWLFVETFEPNNINEISFLSLECMRDSNV